MSSGKMKGETTLNPVTSGMRARYVMMIKESLKQSWCDLRSMD